MKFEFDPKNNHYSFYKINTDNTFEYETINCGSFILDFLDFDIDIFEKKQSLHVYNGKGIYSIRGYNETISSLSSVCNKRILILVLDELSDIFFKLHKEESNIKPEDVLISMCKSLRGMQNDLKKYFINGKFEEDGYGPLFDVSQKIETSFHFEDGIFWVQYDVKNILSLIALDLVNIQNKNLIIKQCENCKKFFIPSKRSDEIYCDRIFKNGKTCKHFGYAEKAKIDPFKYEYTKARKTQHARIQYNSHIPYYKEKYYEPWKADAEKARDHFASIDDIDGFKKWLRENKNKYSNKKEVDD